MYGLITIKEFANNLNKPESTIRTWKRRGHLPSSIFIKIGGEIFIQEEEFKNALANGIFRDVD